jgi:hypothetical protein
MCTSRGRLRKGRGSGATAPPLRFESGWGQTWKTQPHRTHDALTDGAVIDAAAALLGDGRPAMLIQSMFFEGSTTWPHQDTYYQDSIEIGRCVAGWFALEDISAQTERFYVCPTSHLMPPIRNEGEVEFA